MTQPMQPAAPMQHAAQPMQPAAPPRRGRMPEQATQHHQKPQASQSDSGWFRSGGSAVANAQQAQQAQQEAYEKSGNRAFRFKLSYPGAQSGVPECGVLFLDTEFPGFQIREHNFKENHRDKSGKTYEAYSGFEACPCEWETCPLCEAGDTLFGRSYVASFMTILANTPYTSQMRGQVEWARRLLCIKTSQLHDFLQIYQFACEQQGDPSQGGRGMRGVYMFMRREPKVNGKESVGIGKPVMLNDGRMFAIYSEEQMLQMFGHPAYSGGQGNRVLVQQNEDLTPFAYSELFTKPSGIDLSQRYRLGLPPGSTAANQQAWQQPASQMTYANSQAPSAPQSNPVAQPAMPRPAAPMQPMHPPQQEDTDEIPMQHAAQPAAPPSTPQPTAQPSPPQAAPGSRTRRSVMPQVNQDPFATASQS